AVTIAAEAANLGDVEAAIGSHHHRLGCLQAFDPPFRSLRLSAGACDQQYRRNLADWQGHPDVGPHWLCRSWRHDLLPGGERTIFRPPGAHGTPESAPRDDVYPWRVHAPGTRKGRLPAVWVQSCAGCRPIAA